jgi:quercetin dioxygenase-like cupin family protein
MMKETVDLANLARTNAERGPIWTLQSEDLNVNLLALPNGQGVAEHTNAEVDVLLVGIDGEGMVELEGDRHSLRAGQALLIPKGMRRAIRGIGEHFTLLTCHRRRAGLWPAGAPRPSSQRTEVPH